MGNKGYAVTPQQGAVEPSCSAGVEATLPCLVMVDKQHRSIMTRLEGDSQINREIVVDGLDKRVQASITAAGISFWIKGSKKPVRAEKPRAFFFALTRRIEME